MDLMKKNKLVAGFLLAVILGIAFWLRVNAFWLPHWKGDQNHYVALAMKLDEQGLKGYNLREVRLGNLIISKDPPIELSFCKLSEPGDKGDLVRILEMVGQSYYDQPFHHRAPLFPYLLMGAHHLFSSQQPLYGVCSSNLGPRVGSIKPPIVFKTQFWAVIVSIFFNLAVVMMTFILGYRFFNERVASWGAFLIATNPVSVYLAHLLLVEDVLTFFILLSIFLYLSYSEKKNYAGIFVSGIAGGLAILAKQTGGLLLPIIGFYTFLARKKNKKWSSEYLCLGFWVYALAVLLVSGAWFWNIWKHFGDPFFQPASTFSAMRTDRTGWFHEISHRPAPALFFSVGVLFLSPMLSFAFLTWRRFYGQMTDALSRTGRAGVETMLWLWVLGYYFYLVEPWHVLVLTANQEHRFFYMATPAIALLAAVGLEMTRKAWGERTKNFIPVDLVLMGLLALNAWWGIPKAMKVVLSNQLLF